MVIEMNPQTVRVESAKGEPIFYGDALHSQLVRLGELTRKALAHQLDLALEEDLPWDQWFHSG